MSENPATEAAATSAVAAIAAVSTNCCKRLLGTLQKGRMDSPKWVARGVELLPAVGGAAVTAVMIASVERLLPTLSSQLLRRYKLLQQQPFAPCRSNVLQIDRRWLSAFTLGGYSKARHQRAPPLSLPADLQQQLQHSTTASSWEATAAAASQDFSASKLKDFCLLLPPCMRPHLVHECVERESLAAADQEPLLLCSRQPTVQRSLLQHSLHVKKQQQLQLALRQHKFQLQKKGPPACSGEAFFAQQSRFAATADGSFPSVLLPALFKRLITAFPRAASLRQEQQVFVCSFSIRTGRQQQHMLCLPPVATAQGVYAEKEKIGSSPN
ncbi:hypothetical protein Efla_006722 [Eimeria flavescens]